MEQEIYVLDLPMIYIMTQSRLFVTVLTSVQSN